MFRLDPGPGVEWSEATIRPLSRCARRSIRRARSTTLLPPPRRIRRGSTRSPGPPRAAAGRRHQHVSDGAEGVALLRRVVDRFPSGELQIDFFNWLGIRSQKMQTLVRRSGSTLYWAVNSPEDILSRVPGVRLLSPCPSSTRAHSTGHRPGSGWRGAWLAWSRPCAGPCNTIATLSVPLADTGRGMLLGNGAEKRTYRPDRPFRRRRMRVVLDH